MKQHLQSCEDLKYYSGEKLLSLRDKNDLPPDIYCAIGNRSSGKTTFFNSRLYRLWKKKKYRKIGLIYRYKYELKDADVQFFDPITFRFPHDSVIRDTVNERGYVSLLSGGDVLGYGFALNSADNLKKVSNVFNDVDILLWDEFQSADGNYCPNEMEKFDRLYTSIARGGGQMRRRVPVICVSNAISLLNPLMHDLGVANSLTPEMKFLRGDGFVLEQNMNLDAVNSINQSGVSRALGRHISNDIVYEKDNLSNICKMKGQNFYICTILYKGNMYAIRRYMPQNILYCSEKVDICHKSKFTKEDETVDMQWISPPTVEQYRRYFQEGKFYFSSLESKMAVLDFIHY